MRILGHIRPPNSTSISGTLTDSLSPGAPIHLFLRVGDQTVAETHTQPPHGEPSRPAAADNFRLSIDAPIVRRRLSRAIAQSLSSTAKANVYIRCLFSTGETLDLALFKDKDQLGGLNLLGFDGRDGRDLFSAAPTIVETRAPPQAELVCFYLPQFHPIKENDEWWGPGFTEWTNVARMQKQFGTHNAPWLPADLGFYDLRLKDTRRQQAELARQYGITGFCYYVYWFQGQRLLERPLQLLLEDGEPDMPFCLCWANENWSRRWDGSEGELLIGQRHDVEADKKFIDDMAPWLADERYIRVDGKLILLIYRPSLIPERGVVFEHWRRRARELGLGELLICNVMTFGEYDPVPLECDAAVEFPPHSAGAHELPRSHIDAPESYEGLAYDYAEVVRLALGRSYGFSHFPGVMPRWDNTPRKGAKGNVFVNSSPDLFEIWLRDACRRALAQPHDRKLVFVNSWNEWAEGAHLEPDSLYGRAYLDAVRRVTSGASPLANLLRTKDNISLLSREELERALRQALFFNETLGKIIDSVPSAASNRRLLPGLPSEAHAAKIAEGSKLLIETMNQSSTARITLAPSAPLIIRGASILASNFEARHDRTAILLLRSTTSKTGGYQFIEQWQVRADIQAPVRSRPTDVFLGFECRCTLDDVPPGDYQIQLIEFDSDGPHLLVSDRTVEIVR